MGVTTAQRLSELELELSVSISAGNVPNKRKPPISRRFSKRDIVIELR